MSAEPLFTSTLVDTADHHRALRDSVGRLVGKFGRRYFQDVVANNRQPVELWQALGEAGFLGVHISEAYGGGGGGLAELNIAIEETAAQGCPLLSMVIASIVSPIIAAFGSETQKDDWLPGLAKGTRKMAFGITEPNAGSNTHKVSTNARKSATGWVINGAKYWTSAIDESDAVMVVARDGDAVPEGQRAPLSLFIVPTNTPGITMHSVPSQTSCPIVVGPPPRQG